MRAQKWVIAAAFGLIVGGGGGWTAVAEAQDAITALIARDRTPGRTGDTDYNFTTACCTNGGVHIVIVPYTVNEVQIDATALPAVHQRLASESGPWSARDWTLNNNPGDAGPQRDYRLSVGATDVTVRTYANGAYTQWSITVRIIREGPAAIVLSRRTLAVTEEGTHGTYTVRLGSRPTGNVLVQAERATPTGALKVRLRACRGGRV